MRAGQDGMWLEERAEHAGACRRGSYSLAPPSHDIAATGAAPGGQ